MRFFRSDESLPDNAYNNAEAYYAAMREHFREKANHNKAEAQTLFFLSLSFTLVAPLFVTLGEGPFWGKVVPAVASVLAVGATSWLQFRKPQRLWSIYRRAQRELEREKYGFDFCLDEYGNSTNRDKILATQIRQIAYDVHKQWEALIPEPEMLGAVKPMDDKRAVAELARRT